MCGIAGVLHRAEGLQPPSRELLARMVTAMRHRGPDEFGMFRDARVGLAHARLSIVDLATGQQPLSNEAGTLWIIFNGEIFNFVEIREELETRGHRFRTRSDTEVLLRAYEEWGDGCFARLNGQWAFAIWDTLHQRLILSRDRVGVRPLFYTEREGRLLFASEVKSLFADSSIPRAMDPEALGETFTFWSSLSPRSGFAGIRELAPGHTMVVDCARGTDRTFAHWTPRYPDAHERRENMMSLGEATEKLTYHLREATRLRMVRADVPVGSYLSGGIDSSVVASLAREAISDRLQTFSLRFADTEYDETGYQREMVARLGSEHHEIVVSREDIAREFPAVIFHTERPILRTAPAPLFMLSRLVRESGIKVVLTGEGADEMLGGYDLFRENKVRRFWARQPDSKSRPRLFEKMYPYLARSPAHARGMALRFWSKGLTDTDNPAYSHLPRWDGARALTRLFSPAAREATMAHDPIAAFVGTIPAEFTSWSDLGKAQYLEVRTLLSGYLLASQGDRMLMANSIEGRFPFLDRDVMEFSNALPAKYKLAGLDEKHVLKLAARDLVAPSILARRKQPYRAPDALAFVGNGTPPEYVRELFEESALVEPGLFDPRAVRGLYDKCVTRAGDAANFSNADNMAFVGVLSAQLVHRQLVKNAIDCDDNAPWTTCIDRVEPRASLSGVLAAE